MKTSRTFLLLASFAVAAATACGGDDSTPLKPSGSQDASPEASADAGVDAPSTGTVTLSISAGTLVPAFDPAITAYQVKADIHSLTTPFTVTATAPTATTIMVNGTAATSGVATMPISLGLETPTSVDCAFTSGSTTTHYILTVPPQQEAYVKASNTPTTPSGGRFGRVIGMDGDTLVVGASNESTGGSGVNANQNAAVLSGSGAAYIYTRAGSSWTQQAFVKASTPHALDSFGVSVAISGDTVVVGAPGESSKATGVNGDQSDSSAAKSGAAYVFTRTGTTWTQQAYLKASNTRAGNDFGHYVAISGDTIVVTSLLEPSGATGVNGNQADTSAPSSGAAYVFTRTGTTWTQQAYLKPSTSNPADPPAFGSSVAVSGDTVVIGAVSEHSNAAGVNGNQADTSLPAAGAAYVFSRTGSVWSQQAYLKASNPRSSSFFGYSVAVDKDTVAVGAYSETSNAKGINGNQADTSAPEAGAVYVFARTGTTWAQQAYVKASNTATSQAFGSGVAVNGDLLAVGAAYEPSKSTGINGAQADTSSGLAGAAYLFARTGSTWAQTAYLKASNTVADARYGQSVALTADSLAIGAYREPSASVGINGNEKDTSIAGAGAAYVLR